MALGTRCPNCHALFRVAADQLKLRGGLVRCGACQQVFDAIGTLSYLDDASLPTATQAPTPSVGAVIAAIRKAESAAGDAMSTHGTAVLPPPPETNAAPVEVRPSATGTTSAVEAPTDVPPADSAAGSPSPDVTAMSPAIIAASSTAGPPAASGVEHAAAVDGPNEAAPVPLAEMLAAAEATAPSFLREPAAQRSRTRSFVFGAGAALLSLLLLAQLAVAFRAEILVRFPQARPVLGHLCSAFRCTVNWPARSDLLAVVGAELQALPGTSAFELLAVVRNRGDLTLALPAIELTLSDTLNRTVVRRVFTPSDYLAGESDRQTRLLDGLAPGADLTVRIAFEARGVNAAGFVVYPFYL